MKYVVWILKLLVVLAGALCYFCMIKVLYCGCWACNTCIAIGVVATLLGLYDRYKELRANR
ncbi:MAG: hypothetical protein IJ814_02810 [Paludibacteraceae bacterium]|nr:hypothetical protein [Paludibacteraceae bacterium]